MRLLVIAYEFPPIPSPQSLRWTYLVRELARLGHEVHVLAPDVVGYGAGGLPALPRQVTIHRVWPGPMTAFLSSRQRAGMPATGPSASTLAEGALVPSTQGQAAPLPSRLNWKGRIVDRVKTAISWMLYPDIRSEWVPAARRELDRLLAELGPDVVVTSHEPANTIGLGLRARRQGVPWVADLGDPVLAPYTPPRWRKRAFAVERRMCERADLVLVTSLATRDALVERHGLESKRCRVLTQGFDDQFVPGEAERATNPFDAGRLELLYTGSLYAFRRIDQLIDAVAAVPGVRLNVATLIAPPELLEAARAHPDSFRLLGFLSHREALARQHQCDVLVNVSNDDPIQVPGKLYEYLGSGRPVLSIGSGGGAASQLLESTRAGWSVNNDFAAIVAQLETLLAERLRTGSVTRHSSNDRIIMRHSWAGLARNLEAFLEVVVNEGSEGEREHE